MNCVYDGEMKSSWSDVNAIPTSIPMDDVGEEVVVLEPVVHAHLLVVDGQRASVDAPLLQREIETACMQASGGTYME